MRTCVAIAVFLVATASAARADTVISFDLGYMWDRVQVTDRTDVDGALVRFGFRVAFDTFHFGAEVDDSWLTGTTTVPDGQLARTMGVVAAGSPVSGTMVAEKLVAGVHTSLHRPFSLAGELAGGLRDTGVDTDFGNDTAGRKMEPLMEVRTRVDWHLAPSWSVAAVAGTDILVRDDHTFGFLVSANL